MVPFDSNNAGLLDELPEALVIVSLSGEIAFANRALEALTGFSRDELVGQDIGRLMPQPARRRVQAVHWFARWAEDPNPDQLRYLNLEVVTRAGEIRVVSVRVSRHSEGSETWFLVVLRDVTSQRESVAAMRHAQLVTNRILAIGEDAVISIDGHHRIIYCNPVAERMFGYSHAEMTGQPLGMLLPESSRERHDGLIAAFAQGPEASRLMGARQEIAGRRKDGTTLPLEISITRTSIDGETVFSAQVRDVTERKASERALKDSEARFRAVFESAVEAMVLLDPSGTVLEINAAARRMLDDFTPGRRMWDLDWWHGAASATARETLASSVARCASGETIRTRVKLGADAREVDFSMIPVRPEGDAVAYILAEGRDISADVQHGQG